MFNGNILRDAIISAANNLANNRKPVDDLNVFPVPDGDTGTNMSMTLSNAVRELEKVSGETAGMWLLLMHRLCFAVRVATRAL